MEWKWLGLIPAAIGLVAQGALRRRGDPRIMSGEGGPAFETLFDIRECLRAGAAPILPRGWRFWRCRFHPDGPITADHGLAPLQPGDRVWLTVERPHDAHEKAQVRTRHGAIGALAHLDAECRQAIAAQHLVAFVQSVRGAGAAPASIEVLLLSSPFSQAETMLFSRLPTTNGCSGVKSWDQ